MARNPNLREWSDWLEKQSRKGGIDEAIKKEMGRAAARAQRFAKLNATRNPRARTGRLRGSIAAGVKTSSRFAGAGVEAFVSANTDYARIQERGGTVRARGRYLTIPLAAAKTRAGVTRKSARDYPGAFVIRSRAGNLLIVQRRGRQIVPLFVLKAQVKVPATFFLRDAMREAAKRVPAALRAVLVTSASSASIRPGVTP